MKKQEGKAKKASKKATGEASKPTQSKKAKVQKKELTSTARKKQGTSKAAKKAALAKQKQGPVEEMKLKKSKKLTAKDIEKIIKDLTNKGKKKGFVTDAEIKGIFPAEPSTKALNALYDFLADKNIEIVQKLTDNKEKEVLNV